MPARVTGLLIAISCVACLFQIDAAQDDLVQSLNGPFSSASRALQARDKPTEEETAQTQAPNDQNKDRKHDELKEQGEFPVTMAMLKAQIKAAVAKGDFLEASALLKQAQDKAKKTEELILIRDHVDEERGGEDEWAKSSALPHRRDLDAPAHMQVGDAASYLGPGSNGWNPDSNGGLLFWYAQPDPGIQPPTPQPTVVPPPSVPPPSQRPSVPPPTVPQCPPEAPELGVMTPGLPPGTDPQLIKVLAAIGAFDPGLAEYEAPMQIRFASLIVNTWWNCIATLHPYFKDAFTKRTPTISVPEINFGCSMHTTAMRASAGAHAIIYVAERLIPNTKDTVLGTMRAVGVGNGAFGLEERLINCGDGATLDLACLQGAIDDKLAEGLPTSSSLSTEQACGMAQPSITRLVGQAVALQTVAFAMADGWNQFGNEESCAVNCRPFKDTTNFTLGEGDDKWRPMEEDNGMGFYFKHQHVTPHIGTKGKLRFLSDSDRAELIAPKPGYSPDRQAEATEVINRMSTNLRDHTKVQIERFDSKLFVTNMVIAAFLPKCAMQFHDHSGLKSDHAGVHCSYERLVHFVISVINSEYDAAIIVWKEKVNHNMVRPTTVIKRWQDVNITTWSPYRASHVFPARDFEAYKRVMPHAEYPSGSACLCRTLSDAAQAYLGKLGCPDTLEGPNFQRPNEGGGVADTRVPTREPTTREPTTREPTTREPTTRSPQDITCAQSNCQTCLHVATMRRRKKMNECHTGKKSSSENQCKPTKNHIWCGSHRRRRNRRNDDIPIPAGSMDMRRAVISMDESIMVNMAMGITMSPLKAGHSVVEPGTPGKPGTPSSDHTLEYSNTTKMAAACSRSRLDGGMHFSESVPQGERLCKTVGNKGVEWAYTLIL